MSIAYHFNIPRPPSPELDAAVREAIWLRERFGGEIHYQRMSRYRPLSRRRLADLRSIDRQVDLHHLFSNGLYPYPALRSLDKPVVCTLVTGLAHRRAPWFLPLVKPVADWVTAGERDRERLLDWGCTDVTAIPPAIERQRFSDHPPPPREPFYLLAGSAPWSRPQFRTKGVELLLDAVERMPALRLVLLWRGVLGAEIDRRIERRGLAARVEVIHQRVDVNDILARVHAAVVLAKRPDLVKGYPHSLLEALAAGRPIVVSRVLEIAGYAERTGCGSVVDDLDAERFVATLEGLIGRYDEYREAVLGLDLTRFSRSTLLAAYEGVYRAAGSVGSRPRQAPPARRREELP